MLFHLLAMAVNDREVSQEKNAFVTARSNSWNQIILLKNHPEAVSALVKNTSEVCGSLSLTQAFSWRKKLNAMQQCFHFGSNCVCYRQETEDGVLLLGECIVISGRSKTAVKQNEDPEIINAAFFVTENKLNGKLEVRCVPAKENDHTTTARTFGTELLSMILKSEEAHSGLGRETPETKKTIWQKLTGN